MYVLSCVYIFDAGACSCDMGFTVWKVWLNFSLRQISLCTILSIIRDGIRHQCGHTYIIEVYVRGQVKAVHVGDESPGQPNSVTRPTPIGFQAAVVSWKHDLDRPSSRWSAPHDLRTRQCRMTLYFTCQRNWWQIFSPHGDCRFPFGRCTTEDCSVINNSFVRKNPVLTEIPCIVPSTHYTHYIEYTNNL